MAKKMRFLVLDSETATLGFANEIANGNAEVKKKIAIAKPLIYNIGWVITDRQGNIEKKVEYLIAEIFSVPSIFNTAYYADKRPIYLEKMQKGELTVVPWEVAVKELEADLQTVNAIGCYNSMFDLWKAIPFTELYISKLYSPNYYSWEKAQRGLCERLVNAPKPNEPSGRANDIFTLRGKDYPMFDLWGLSCEHLINTLTYRKNCLEHGMVSGSGLYFKSSAESSYRYICDRYDFDEAHTALEDAIIEAKLLVKIAKKHAITNGVAYFPFRLLGTTVDFCHEYYGTRKCPKVTEENVRTVIEILTSYAAKNCSKYADRMESYAERLEMLLRA